MDEYRCIGCGATYGSFIASCSMCMEPGLVLRLGVRPAARVDALPEETTALALCKAAFTLQTSEAYPSLHVGAGTLMLVYGPPGNGKSTFTTKFVDGIEGPVVLQAVEETIGPALHARFRRCGVRRDDFHIVGRASVDQLADIVRRRRAVALAIDSTQMAAFTAEELRHLLVVLPDLRVLVAVSQVNKSGRPEGRERLVHEADVAIECSEMQWRVTKSRFQPVGLSGSVLPTEVTHAAE